MKILAQTNASGIDITGTQVSDAGLLAVVQDKKLKTIRISIGRVSTAHGIDKFKQLRPDVDVHVNFTRRSAYPVRTTIGLDSIAPVWC